MNADIDGGARILGVAAGFDWTWSETDLELFSALVGWDAQIRPGSGATLVTHLDVQKPYAYAEIGDYVKYISIRFTDVVDASDVEHRSALAAYFGEMCDRATSALGAPTRVSPGSIPTVRWWMAKVLVEIAGFSSGTCIRLVNPEYQRWVDSLDDSEAM
ncbi:DUF6301 family protein [Nocardia sp. NPDC059091]|uniref:DUF6301 family protein n=1 Tax=unclassified Nocardia TaxID=2637762 RepID=UPI003680D2C6